MPRTSIIDVLDEVAEYLLCLAGEPSYWYTLQLQSSCDDKNNLSHRLGITDYDKYESLLIAAGLAKVIKGKVYIQKGGWDALFRHHRLVSVVELIEMTTVRIEINKKRKDIHVIRIGRVDSNSHRTYGIQKKLNMTPPRPSSNVRLQQQAFLRSTAVAIEHTRMEMLCNNERITTTVITTPCRKSNDKSNATIITPPDQSATMPDADPSPVGKQMYPILASLFNEFDPYDDKVQSLLSPLLSEVFHLLDASREGLKVNNLAGYHEASYIKIPRASSDKSFNNSKTWVDDALSLNHGSNESTFESAMRLTNHLIRFYNDSVVEALKRKGMAIAQPMTTTQYVAMLSSLGISGKKEKELAKYLRHYLGKSFIPSRKDVWMLAEGHASVKAHSLQWHYEEGKRAEKVHWSEKDINSEIEIQLARELIAHDVKPSDVHTVRVVIGGDFGDTAFQFIAEVTAILKNSERIKFRVSSLSLYAKQTLQCY